MKVNENGLTLIVDLDLEPTSPREDYENLGIMLCWHRRYNLGDKNQYKSPSDFLNSVEAKDIFLQLPLYLYDHSGITMSHRDFNDRFDSGRIGFIYVTREKVKEWYGGLSDETKLKANRQLLDEIADYADYLEGNIYKYQIEDEDGLILDSSSGYSGRHHFREVVKSMKENSSKDYQGIFEAMISRINSYTIA